MSDQRGKYLAIWKSLSPAQKKALDLAADRTEKLHAAIQAGQIHGATTVSLRRRGLLVPIGGLLRISEKGKAVFGSVGEPVRWKDLA